MLLFKYQVSFSAAESMVLPQNLWRLWYDSSHNFFMHSYHIQQHQFCWIAPPRFLGNLNLFQQVWTYIRISSVKGHTHNTVICPIKQSKNGKEWLILIYTHTNVFFTSCLPDQLVSYHQYNTTTGHFIEL